MTHVAVNGCLSFKSFSSDKALSVLPLWLENQTETRLFSSCDHWKAVIRSLKLVECFFFFFLLYTLVDINQSPLNVSQQQLLCSLNSLSTSEGPVY